MVVDVRDPRKNHTERLVHFPEKRVPVWIPLAQPNSL